MSLVRGIDASQTKQKIVGSVVGLCRDMGIGLVSEGVESVAERDTLSSIGCDLMQGYLFSRPGPAFPEASF
jgi:EAL domain-containing protein (putative c-di-GMP-specific phosphodiesterase class I)